MENMDRKKKKEVKGDDDHGIGGKKGNGDDGVLSWANDSQFVDNLEVKKKRKKSKDKGSKKERDECAVSGHAAEDINGEESVRAEEHVELKKNKKKKKSKEKEQRTEKERDDMEINGEESVRVEEHVESKKNKKKKSKEKEQRSEKEKDEYRSIENGEKGEVVEENVELKKNKKKKKKEKGQRNEKEKDEDRSSDHIVENERTCNGKDGANSAVLEEHGVGLKAKTKKKKKEKSSNGRKGAEKGSDVQGLSTPEESLDIDIIDKFKQNRKRKKRQSSNDLEQVEEIPDEILAEQDKNKATRKKKRKAEKEKAADCSRDVVVTGESFDKEVPEDIGRKKRKTGSGKNKKLDKDHVSCEGSATIEMESNDKGEGKKMKQPGKTKAKKDKKKVSFSSEVEVFPASSDSGNQKSSEPDNLVYGKRFTPEEDKMIEEAVRNYIEERCLGEDGLDMVMNSRNHVEVRGCWDEIAMALPHRPPLAVYRRGKLILDRGEKRRWTEEENELLMKLHAEHGNNWKLLSEELGRNRYHVKDTWRRLKHVNRQRGKWSQEEYQNLFDLVNTDLRLKVSEEEEKYNKYGMLRDNIHWTAISDTLPTRTGPRCCIVWYSNLSSPMVAEGVWADSDDYRLVKELFTLDASCIEDVDWDNLLGNRSGDVCRKRWNQMVRHIGNHTSKSFSEQVEILAKRYNPELIEVREAWDNKPRVD